MDQKEIELLAQLVTEARTTNRLLTLAFGDAIEKRVRIAADSPSARTILALLLDGEVTADALQTASRTRGVSRTTLYRQLAELERAGIVERPRRGVVALSSVVEPYLGNLRTMKDAATAGAEVATE